MFYFTFALLVFSTPSLLTVYGLKLRLFHSFIIYSFIITIAFLLVFFVPYHAAIYSIPALFPNISHVNEHLTFCTNRLSKTIAIVSVIGLMTRFVFFIGFSILLISDRFIRVILSAFVGRHLSGNKLSICGTMDPELELSIKEKQGFKQINLNNYSPSIAYLLASASKLSYEDIDVIKYELEKSGFDVQCSFKPLAYKNMCAFVVEKEDNIILVFRGTNPMNIQNYKTNMTIKRTTVYSKKGLMGRVHRGYWKAMGDPSSVNKKKQRSRPTLNKRNSTPSIYKFFFGIIQDIIEVLLFGLTSGLQHIIEPVDSSWIHSSSSKINLRSQSMYIQAEEYILQLIQRNPKRRKNLYIAGHSLGGSMGSIFLAKMIQSDSSLLNYFTGLYTYGQPKVGDSQFSKSFGPDISRKIFLHVYNNDIVPRISILGKYDTPPGNMIFLKPGHSMTFYPSDDGNLTVFTPPPISFINSGLFDRIVLQQLVHENKIRILFRILFPFFLNDHFPSDYCNALRCIVQV